MIKERIIEWLPFNKRWRVDYERILFAFNALSKLVGLLGLLEIRAILVRSPIMTWTNFMAWDSVRLHQKFMENMHTICYSCDTLTSFFLHGSHTILFGVSTPARYPSNTHNLQHLTQLVDGAECFRLVVFLGAPNSSIIGLILDDECDDSNNCLCVTQYLVFFEASVVLFGIVTILTDTSQMNMLL